MIKDDSAIQRLSGGLKIPTVSSGELGDFNYSTFDTIKEYIKNFIPSFIRMQSLLKSIPMVWYLG